MKDNMARFPFIAIITREENFRRFSIRSVHKATYLLLLYLLSMMFVPTDGAACGDISLIVSRVAWSSVITRIFAGLVAKNGAFFFFLSREYAE